jgi:hypothetical protein
MFAPVQARGKRERLKAGWAQISFWQSFGKKVSI